MKILHIHNIFQQLPYDFPFFLYSLSDITAALYSSLLSIGLGFIRCGKEPSLGGTESGSSVHQNRALFRNSIFYFFNIYFLLEFDLPTYSTTPSAHPVKCPPQCPSPSHPISPPTSPSTTPCLFPRVRSLSCFFTLSDFSHSFSLLSPLIPFTIFYITHMSETI